MTELRNRHCRIIERGETPLAAAALEPLLQALHADWTLNAAGDAIQRVFRFKDFYQTMAFVNGLALIAHEEDHHPEMRVTYNTCSVNLTTHAAAGLTENDFICAAKIDALPVASS